MIVKVFPKRAEAYRDKGIPMHIIESMFTGIMSIRDGKFIQAYGRDRAEAMQLLNQYLTTL